MRQRCEVQELEVQKSAKKAQEAMKLASEETAKSEAANEVIKSLTTQVTLLSMFLLNRLSVTPTNMIKFDLSS